MGLESQQVEESDSNDVSFSHLVFTKAMIPNNSEVFSFTPRCRCKTASVTPCQLMKEQIRFTLASTAAVKRSGLPKWKDGERKGAKTNSR